MSRVVVVGGGLAGWVTAVAAAEAGVEVVLLEKLDEPGGSTVLSGGFFALADTPAQRERGIHDDVQALERDLLEVGQHLNDYDLVHAYAAGQAEFIEWLIEHGLELREVELSSGQTVARSHPTDVASFVSGLVSAAEGLGVEVRYGTPATGLVTQDGAVVGVETPSGVVSADAVVIASGGFTRSEELLSRYAPEQARALRTGGEGNTGDGLHMAMAIGAGLRDMDCIKGTFGAHPWSRPDRDGILLVYYLGAVIVNARGERYVDESMSYKLLGDACLSQETPFSYVVFDQGVVDASPVGVALFDPRPLIDAGKVVSADSLEELAVRIDLPAATLRSEVDAYNEAANGRVPDRLGRSGLVSGSGALRVLDRAPYYAFPATSSVLATYCGLSVDSRARVLMASDGTHIPGLWACGEVIGGFHGAAYMTGSSLGKSAFFGIVAGRESAQYSKNRRARNEHA